MMTMPQGYVEIDATKIALKLVPPIPVRLSTREKFRARRLCRKMRMMLMDNFRGQPMNAETRQAVKAAIERHFGEWKF